MSTIKTTLPERVELKYLTDIIVLGGGPGGIGAAVAAARKGKNVLLIEHYGFLGGMATAGEVNPFMGNHLNGKSLDTGVFTDWLNKIDEYGGLRETVFDPYSARLAAEDICLEAGVKILYHHRLAHVETENGKITSIILHSKSGLQGAKAKVYIDSTGDGDLAFMAGCEIEYGSKKTGGVQPMTTCFKLKLASEDISGLDVINEQLGRPVKEKLFNRIQEVFQKGKESGAISCPRENVLIFKSIDRHTIHFNTTRVVGKSAIDGEQLSQAEILGRKQIREMITLFRKELNEFKHCQIYSIATQIGIRESRRVIGKKYITREDFVNGTTYHDGITRITYPIDIHSPTGAGTELIHIEPGKWYEIPYGAIVPNKIDNLLMACRAISADHALHSSLRVMPPVCSIGQAAGTAAVMSIEKNCNVEEIDGKELKRDLIKQGCNLV
jgi:FAD dependent oxidoreductase